MLNSHKRDIAKLITKQAAGLLLALPTAGMSLAWNLTSIDDYQRKYHPNFKYPFIN